MIRQPYPVGSLAATTTVPGAADLTGAPIGPALSRLLWPFSPKRWVIAPPSGQDSGPPGTFNEAAWTAAVASAAAAETGRAVDVGAGCTRSAGVGSAATGVATGGTPPGMSRRWPGISSRS